MRNLTFLPTATAVERPDLLGQRRVGVYSVGGATMFKMR